MNDHRRLAAQFHLDHAFIGDVKVLELRRLIMPSSDDSTSAVRIGNAVRPKT
jgi:hypothetical protein